MNERDIDNGRLIHDTEMEKIVAVSLMSSYQAYPEVRDILTSDCFHDQKLREIFETISELYDRGEKPEMVMVGNELAKKGSRVDRIELAELMVETQPVFSLREYALTLKEFALRRKMWEIGYNLMMKSGNQAELIEVLHNEAKTAIDGLFEDVGDELLTMEDTYRSLQEEMIIRNSNPGTITGTPTGFAELDANGGLNGSDLIVVGAETSQGKTSFATALAMSAIENGDNVAFYSMEMTPGQLTARIASMRSGINAKRILYEGLTMEEIARTDAAMEGIDKSLMHFDGKSTSSLDHIVRSIRNMKMKHGIKGAVVDYLQLVNIAGKELTPEQCVARVARDLKNLAKELDIWIIAISQLSRNPNNPLPSLSRLRSSGQIEEAADNIILIYRPRDRRYPEPYSDIPTTGTAMVTIAKGRHVGTNEFLCGFKAENTLFYPLKENEIAWLRNQSYFSNESDNEEPF